MKETRAAGASCCLPVRLRETIENAKTMPVTATTRHVRLKTVPVEKARRNAGEGTGQRSLRRMLCSGSTRVPHYHRILMYARRFAYMINRVVAWRCGYLSWEACTLQMLCDRFVGQFRNGVVETRDRQQRVFADMLDIHYEHVAEMRGLWQTA
jgi:hypothetical protein